MSTRLRCTVCQGALIPAAIPRHRTAASCTHHWACVQHGRQWTTSANLALGDCPPCRPETRPLLAQAEAEPA